PDGSFATCELFGTNIDRFARDGTLLGSLDLSTVAGLPNSRCVTIAYIPSADAYAIRVRGSANATTVFVVSSSGTLLSSVVTPTHFTLTTLPGQPGNFGVAGLDNVLRTYDASGTLVDQHAVATGSLLEPFGYAGGPAGRYAVTDPNDSEVALFGP